MCPYKGSRDTLPWIQRIWNDYLNRVRVVVENTIARLKVFKCLSVKWRHGERAHKLVFTVIANIVNLELMLHPIRINNTHIYKTLVFLKFPQL